MFTHLEARGTLRGLVVRVVLAMCNTRTGTEPFTTIEIEEDLDVCVYTGGAAWPYPSWEAHSAFTSARLANKAAAGAPRALLTRITHGPIADRLGAIGITRLTIGSEAKRDECACRGVHLEVEGWPMDLATLRFMIDTALDVALATRHEIAGGAGWRGGRHPEVVANETARASSRKQGLKVAAAVFAGLTTLTLLVVAAMIRLM